MKRTSTLVTLVIVALLAACGQPAAPASTATRPAPGAEVDMTQALAQFEAELEAIRQELRIPGMSAAIVKDQELIWAKGFGYADLENKVQATPDTPYRLASVTKPIAATLIMQLVEEGTLHLDDPVEQYGVHLESEGVVQVYHLLTHTSEGVPGTHHNYSGNRYSLLGQVIERASGKPFAALLAERILDPLGMAHTAPNYAQCALGGLLASTETSERERNDVQVNRAVAKPYQLDPSYDIVEGSYPAGCSPAAGLISSVTDLCKFDIALDHNVLLGQDTVEEMIAPAFSTLSGRTDLMYGLGWYVQQFKGTRLVWHSGRQPPSVSSLYLKVPDLDLTFIILANTTYLNSPYPFGYGDALYCTPALAFYETFVFPQRYGRAMPEIDWTAGERDLVNQLKQVKDADVREVLERELWSYHQLYASMDKTELADRLSRVHRQAFPGSPVDSLDAYTFRGVEYYPVAREKVQLTSADLQRFTGRYTLSEMPQIDGADLPTEVEIELQQGKLVGLAAEGCITLLAIAPDRFVMPENPGVELAFHVDGDEVESLTLEAGEIVVVYRPGG